MTDIGNFDKAGCRKEGCLEATAGLGNLFANVRALMDKGGAQILRDLLEQNGQVLSLTLIEQACILQDEDVLKVFDETMKRWAMAIVNMTVILDPDLVLLGGALGSANTSVLFRIQNYLSKILFYDVDIRLSELGEDAQLLGGIHLLKKHVYNHVITNMIIQGA
jgi:predicted NBD/HSP70 family sugar kinase